MGRGYIQHKPTIALSDSELENYFRVGREKLHFIRAGKDRKKKYTTYYALSTLISFEEFGKVKHLFKYFSPEDRNKTQKVLFGGWWIEWLITGQKLKEAEEILCIKPELRRDVLDVTERVAAREAKRENAEREKERKKEEKRRKNTPKIEREYCKECGREIYGDNDEEDY